MTHPPIAPDRTVTLDALRGVAAWLVLVSHVGFWTGATSSGAIGGLAARGDAGVAVFFAISALLLAGPLVRRALGGSTGWTVTTYARRRLARILPGYYLALAGVVVAAVLVGDPAGALDAGSLVVHLLLAQGFTGRTFQSFTQTWSLTTELTFYVLLPLIAAAVAPWAARASDRAGVARRLLVLCGLAGAGGLLLQALVSPATGAGAGWWAGALATSAPGHAAWFAVGAGLTVVIEAERAGVPVARGRAAVALETARSSPGTMLLAAGALYLVAATPLAGPRGLADPTLTAVLAKEILYAGTALALLLAATARGVPEAAWSSGRRGSWRWLGDTSYGVFLWHVLVLQVTFAVLDLTLFAAPFWPVLLLVTVVSLALGHLSWTLVERHVIAAAHRSRASAAPRPAARG